MSAVLQRDPEDEFFDSQMLPPQERGVTFEALYFRQLQLVTNRIHETENIDQIMLEASQDICKLFNADRLTLYAVNEDRSSIISKVKTGLNTSRDLKLPISAQSIAGYVAMARQMVNIADVYDVDALKKIHPALSFLQEVDKRSGYRTKQMLVAPVMDGDTCTASCRSSTTAATSPSESWRRMARASCARRLASPYASACRGRMMPAPQGHQVRRAGSRRRAVAGRTAAVHPAGARRGQVGRAYADGRLSHPPRPDRPVAGQVLRRGL
jgi:GAF domain-containing protein